MPLVFPATLCQAARNDIPEHGRSSDGVRVRPLNKLWFEPPPADAAMVTFTQSLPGSSVTVSVTFVPSNEVQAAPRPNDYGGLLDGKRS